MNGTCLPSHMCMSGLVAAWPTQQMSQLPYSMEAQLSWKCWVGTTALGTPASLSSSMRPSPLQHVCPWFWCAQCITTSSTALVPGTGTSGTFAACGAAVTTSGSSCAAGAYYCAASNTCSASPFVQSACSSSSQVGRMGGWEVGGDAGPAQCI